jgi:hypothetical protein
MKTFALISLSLLLFASLDRAEANSGLSCVLTVGNNDGYAQVYSTCDGVKSNEPYVLMRRLSDGSTVERGHDELLTEALYPFLNSGMKVVNCDYTAAVKEGRETVKLATTRCLLVKSKE